MIKIKEDVTTKIPGLTSLYITLNPVDTNVLNILHQCPPYNYNKNIKSWEIPVTRLSKFINMATKFDDIELDLMKNVPIKKLDYEPSKFRTKPYQHQIEVIKYGLQHDNFLLLDAPGLGKTISLIYLAQELKKKENIEHCLIICGINSLKVNWEKEIEKHSDLNCIIPGKRITKTGKTLYGSIDDRLKALSQPIKEFFVILNIESLREDKILKILKNGPNRFDMIAIDELHVAKSSQSSQGKNLLKLTNAKHKIGMTGTLLLNNPVDVYVPLKWIGAEHSTLTNFKSQYIEYGGFFNNEVVGYKNIDSLKDQIASVSLRRTKDLLDLPEKNIIDEYLDMNNDQDKFYHDIVNGVLNEVDKVNINTSIVLSMVTRLRQATSCPSVLTTSPISSIKVQRCIDHVTEIVASGNKVVIFSQFKKTIEDLLSELKEYNPLVCTGDIHDSIISENVDKFQNDDEHMVMICTAQKMGTGFTLNRAAYAIFVDTSFVHGIQEQNEDRIHRIGSKQPVFIYRLWCNNTFDLRVKQLIDNKRVLSDYIIDNTAGSDAKEILRSLILNEGIENSILT